MSLKRKEAPFTTQNTFSGKFSHKPVNVMQVKLSLTRDDQSKVHVHALTTSTLVGLKFFKRKATLLKETEINKPLQRKT